MIDFVKPLINDQVNQTPYVAFGGDMIHYLESFFSSLPTVPVPGFGSAGATVLVPLLGKFGFKLPAIQYLYDRYQK
jgi:hypothetical protein